MSNVATLTISGSSQSGGPIHLLLTAYRHLALRIERARVSGHLADLDDRLLADIGLARRDIAKLLR
ncbi:MAG TPA: DUF1127 domain-containing protein [Aliidongia sp.]|uniref:DUF1127 domain-containing protein n=1 Tax=Aliidongia sp. TaxID=1914230 RepID=UPI002DDD2360|nr:DUF1127 domain-containing protein [Aliidongia sp.]HEV2676677.1 DUF1127 domain-containing protein [Aliidongia sp.]